MRIFDQDSLRLCSEQIPNIFVYLSMGENMNKMMKRIFLAALIVAGAGGAAAQAQSFTEGVDYIVLPGEAEVLPDGNVEVLEFFWFACPSCFRFEPYLVAWDIPPAIDFKNVPATFSDRWVFHAHIYYAMELLDLKDKLMQKFYDEIHINGTRMRNFDQFVEWAAPIAETDADKLAATLTSFAVQSKVSQAAHLASKYKVTGVPTLVVGGKYKTSPSMVQSEEKALRVVEYLAQKILAE